MGDKFVLHERNRSSRSHRESRSDPMVTADEMAVHDAHPDRAIYTGVAFRGYGDPPGKGGENSSSILTYCAMGLRRVHRDDSQRVRPIKNIQREPNQRTMPAPANHR